MSVQISAQSVELLAGWNKGDTKKIKSQDGFIEYEGNEIIKKEVITSMIDMTILEVSDSSYTIEWNYYEGSTDKLNIEEEEDEDLYKEIDRLFEKLRIVYTTDKFGIYEGIINMQEIETTLTDALQDFVSTNFEDQKEGEMFFELMNAMLLSEEMEDEISSEIQAYHYYLGEIFSDTLAQYDEEIPSQMGKETIAVKGEVQVLINAVGSTIKINDKKVFDPIALKNAMIGAGKEIKKGKKKMKQAFGDHEFDMIDTEKYTYYFQTGSLLFYEKKRSFSSGEKRKDSFLILEEVKL